MTSNARIVLVNGRSFRAKFLGKRLSWLILGRKNRKSYYPVEQVRRVIITK